MNAQRWCYNTIIAALRALNSPIYPIVPGVGPVLVCSLNGAEKRRKSFEAEGMVAEGYPLKEWREWRGFDAWSAIKAHCDWMPYHDRDSGKASSKYGIGSKQVSGMCQTMRGAIQGFFTKRKKGDFKAQLPSQFRSVMSPSGWLWEVGKAEISWHGSTLLLGAKTQIGGVVRVGVCKPYVGRLINKAVISRDESHQFWLHLSYQREMLPDADLTQSAGIDLGQKRAMAISLGNGKSVILTGRDICGLKRDRDRRFRGIQRLRSRVFRGQVRQCLTPQQQATMRELEEKSPGSGTKYAYRMLSEFRQHQGWKKRSRRDWKLLQAQKRVRALTQRRIKYANHCITRRAADWLRENKVGAVYVGDIGSIPKGRKKGQKRQKQVKRNALWEYGNQRKLLEEKLQEYGATLHAPTPEHFTSQTCPSCGTRRKPRGRHYLCRSCGWKGDRDGVGAANILARSLSSEWPATGRIVPRHVRPLMIAPAMRKVGRLHVGAVRPQPLEGPLPF